MSFKVFYNSFFFSLFLLFCKLWWQQSSCLIASLLGTKGREINLLSRWGPEEWGYTRRPIAPRLYWVQGQVIRFSPTPFLLSAHHHKQISLWFNVTLNSRAQKPYFAILPPFLDRKIFRINHFFFQPRKNLLSNKFYSPSQTDWPLTKICPINCSVKIKVKK